MLSSAPSFLLSTSRSAFSQLKDNWAKAISEKRRKFAEICAGTLKKHAIYHIHYTLSPTREWNLVFHAMLVAFLRIDFFLHSMTPLKFSFILLFNTQQAREENESSLDKFKLRWNLEIHINTHKTTEAPIPPAPRPRESFSQETHIKNKFFYVYLWTLNNFFLPSHLSTIIWFEKRNKYFDSFIIMFA